MMLFNLLLFAAVAAINEFCPSIKKSPFFRRDLAKSFNALFRQIESPNLPCIPELNDLNCEEIKSITNKKGRRRNIQKCFAQALSHKKYIGNFKTGEHCFLFFKIRGRKLTKNECLAVLDRSANRLYPLNTKECLEKNFYLKDGRQLSSSECIEIVDKREMFIIKSARRILSRDPETKEECLTSDFFYNGNYLSIFECEERFESLKTAAPEIEEDFGIGPRHRQDCEDYEFFVDDKPLSIEECLQLLR
ncbi:unnamed protein product [Oikopleura dioica]|uniref:Uncharacterized protein n=1 Tax=Oikopleura dioica TaxID=34765 RepID=E4YM55_OIKDI|nr:unnamed protein product [Oikopleura dioica]